MNNNLYIEDEFEIPSLNTEIETREVKGRDGFILGEKRVQGYNFPIPFIYVNHEKKDYQDIMNELVEFFNRDKEVRLRFEGEYWYWNIIFTGTIQFNQTTQGFVRFELNCIISDPYKHSNERYNTISEDDHLTIYNKGTAPTYPVFKATAKEDSTMMMLTKDDEDYFMIGEPEDVFKTNVKTKPTVYSTQFNTTTGWTYNNNEDTVNDVYVGGNVGGATTIDNGAVAIQSLPNTEAGWRGATMKRSLSESMNDFDITAQVRLYSHLNQKGTAKSMVHLYDEQNNLVAALGLLDASGSRAASLFVAVFDEYGNRKTICNEPHPMFNQSGHTHIRLTRVDNEYQVKAWRVTDWENYNQSDIYNTRFIDAGELYKRPVRQVGFYLSRHTNTLSGYQTDPAIYFLQVSRPAGSKENEIPYVVSAGDVVEVNTQKEVILLNGEPMTQLKDFGSNYFSVESGLVEVLIEPQEVFDVTAEWRDRFY